MLHKVVFDYEKAFFDLEEKGFFIWNDFLSFDEVATVKVDFKHFRDAGSFSRAGIGKGKSAQVLDEIRKDETYWLDPLLLTSSQSVFWDRLDHLKDKLNEHFYLGLWLLEGHYSLYPIDSHYRKHLDRFSSDDLRTVTLVLYLNEGWVEKDGGALGLHPIHGKKGGEHLFLPPMAGSLVCFMSADMPHEVMRVHKERQSFAGWWKRR